jgi:alanyl-tRNA synthetase
VIDGHAAADLYQTFGVPPELFESLAAERNLTFDWSGFKAAMEEHGRVSSGDQAVLFKTGPIEALKKSLHKTEFLGYQTTEAEAEVKGIVAQDHLLDELTEVGHDQPVILVLDRTPFYGESGGQVGDSGTITGPGFEFKVTDTQKDGDLILHQGHLAQGKLTAGAKVKARVDVSRRGGIQRAHSATHVLHHALQSTLGKHAQQQGSKVDEDWLRFDFSNPAAVTTEQVAAIEAIVNDRISESAPVRWDIVPLAEARKSGAMMLFGEKYPDPVRMVTMGRFSKELCGGTHLDNTSEIDAFEVVSEEGVAAGTRRIVALTGIKAKENMLKTRAVLAKAAEELGVTPADVPEAVKSLSHYLRDLRKVLSSGSSQNVPGQ